MADVAPKVKGGPPATSGHDTKPGGASVFTKQVGPLPVYGWIVVGAAGLFLYKKLYKAAPITPTTVDNGAGTGIWIPPGNTTSPPPSVPAGTGNIPISVAVDGILTQKRADHNPVPVDAAGRKFLHDLAKLPTTQEHQAMSFFDTNIAYRDLGLPYFNGKKGPHGMPIIYDPKTKQSTELSLGATK